jgi:hypothetical protein
VKLTPSRLGLVARCTAAAVLPEVVEDPSDAMAAGTGRHAFLSALGQTRDRERALATIPEGAPWRAACEAIDADALLDGTESIEVDLRHAYDVHAGTARPLPPDEHRRYGDTSEGEIPGTLDWLVTVRGGRLEVVDFKGTWRVPPAAENLQLATYALQVARARGVDEIDVAIAYVDEDGTIEWDRATLGPWDLAATATRLREIVDRVGAALVQLAGGRQPEASVGPWCGHCPALRTCPAHVTLAARFAGGALDLTPEALVRLDDAGVGRAHETVERLQAILDAVRATIRVRVGAGPVPLSDGTELYMLETRPRSLDVARALPVLREKVGERADALVKRSIPAEVVQRLGRELGAGRRGGMKAETEALWEKLELAGAVKTATVASVRTRKARGAGAPAELPPAERGGEEAAA